VRKIRYMSASSQCGGSRSTERDILTVQCDVVEADFLELEARLDCLEPCVGFYPWSEHLWRKLLVPVNLLEMVCGALVLVLLLVMYGTSLLEIDQAAEGVA
jgi:hypothetical protein